MNSQDTPLTDKDFAPRPPTAEPSEDKRGEQGGFEPPRPGIPPGPAGPDIIQRPGANP